MGYTVTDLTVSESDGVESLGTRLLSCENEREGLLLDCRVGVKESESEDDSS